MQSFKLLLKNPPTGVTSADTVSLQQDQVFEGQYFGFDQSGLNRGVVTQWNVNQYLDDPVNAEVANDFMSYITSNTSDIELKEILDSDKKLADTFVEYYANSITSGLTSPTSIINNQLTGTTQITYDELQYQLEYASKIDGPLGTPTTIIAPNSRKNTTKTELTTFSEEESFYIPVKLHRNYVDSSRIDFTEFTQDCFKKVDGEEKFFKQCFVELNYETNPEEFWSDSTTSPVSPDEEVVITKEIEICNMVEVSPAKKAVWICERALTTGEVLETYASETSETGFEIIGNPFTGFAVVTTCTLVSPALPAVFEEVCTTHIVPA